VIQDEVCYNLQNWYAALKNEQFDTIDNTYESMLYLSGTEAQYNTKDGPITGTIKGVNRNGQLIIFTDTGDTRIFSFKEIEFINPPQTSH